MRRRAVEVACTPGRCGLCDFYRGCVERGEITRMEARALRPAGDELRRRLADAGSFEDGFAAYREYLGTALTRISPLLLRLCDLEGVDLDGLVAGLHPGGGWPQWLCGVRPRDRWARAGGQVSLRKMSRVEAIAISFETAVHDGVVIRDRGDTGGIPFGVRPLGRGLELGAFLGEARLRTHGASGSITVRGGLPVTMAAALPGRRLDDLVGHSLLDDAVAW